MVKIEIDEEVYEALDLPEEDREAALETEFAVSLYDRGILPFGKARSLASLSRREFHRLLGDREVDRHYTDEELDEDAEYARG